MSTNNTAKNYKLKKKARMREPELDDDSSELPDWKLPLAFNDARHAESQSGAAHTVSTQTWRMKERVGHGTRTPR